MAGTREFQPDSLQSTFLERKKNSKVLFCLCQRRHQEGHLGWGSAPVHGVKKEW